MPNGKFRFLVTVATALGGLGLGVPAQAISETVVPSRQMSLANLDSTELYQQIYENVLQSTLILKKQL